MPQTTLEKLTALPTPAGFLGHFGRGIKGKRMERRGKKNEREKTVRLGMRGRVGSRGVEGI